MVTRAEKYVKGRSVKPVGEGKLMRKAKTSGKTGIRKVRKQRDIKISGHKGHAKRHVRTKSR